MRIYKLPRTSAAKYQILTRCRCTLSPGCAGSTSGGGWQVGTKWGRWLGGEAGTDWDGWLLVKLFKLTRSCEAHMCKSGDLGTANCDEVT